MLWYQGESNSLEAWRVAQHEELLPKLIADWRARWGLGDLPFGLCQLSSIGTAGGYQSQHWPEFRDSQRRLAATLPQVGLVVTSDLGHPTDVHPRNKREVGRRAALWSLSRVYGQPVAGSGPLPAHVSIAGGRLVVRFAHAEGGLRTADGQPPRGFEVQSADGAWRASVPELAGNEARLGLGGTAVRYGWQPYTTANLVNGAGLPAPTFREPVSAAPAG